MKRIYTLLTIFLLALSATAQVGEHRSQFAVGANAGYILSNIGFVPKIPQTMHGGITFGGSARYVCEKYFNTICSVQAEVNIAQTGWKEEILDNLDKPCINNVSGVAEEYKRTMTYIQVPIFAHLAWGKEQRGTQFFFQVGPQFGYLLGESTTATFDVANAMDTTPQRVNGTIEQYSKPAENSLDYGIAAGLGAEQSIPSLGHIQLEARYYYGLGNIYGDSKRDFFARSNFGNIVIKATWMVDL